MSTTSIPDPNSNTKPSTGDNRRNLKVSPDFSKRIARGAAALYLTREEYVEQAVRYFEDRTASGYLAENSFMIRELAALEVALEQLVIADRVLAEALVSLEGAALRALIRAAALAESLSNKAKNESANETTPMSKS